MHSEGFFRHVDLAEDRVEAVFRHCMAEEFFVVSEGADGIDGMFAGHIGEFWFSRETCASDIVFFVRPTRRGGLAAVRMIQEFVAWARVRRAAEVSISQSSGVRLEETQRLFTGMGFTYVGGIYKWRFG